MCGFIKLHRKLLDSALWKDCTPEQKTILLTLLMMAPFKGNKWIFKGEEYVTKPGEFITSLPSLVSACGKDITTRKVRTALDKFEKFGFLTNKSTNKNRMISIVNWDTYQGDDRVIDRQVDRQLTGNRQAVDRQLTAIEEGKKEKKVKKEDSEAKAITAIIDFLNEKAGKNFKASAKGNKKFILARLREGFTIEDFKTVILKKVKAWEDKPEMKAYLRPETLFGNKFDSYLNETVKGVSRVSNEGLPEKIPFTLEEITPAVREFMEKIHGNKFKFAKNWGAEKDHLSFTVQQELEKIRLRIGG